MARLIDEGMIAQLSKKQGYFLKYFPARIRNVGEDAKEDRKLIYAFKDARDDAYKLVAQMVDGYLKREYGEQVRGKIRLLFSLGFRKFVSGMALGFDMLAAEEVIKLKEELKGVKLVAVIPYRGQSGRWTPYQRERYQRILNEVDEEIVLSEGYYNGCLLKRNDYMLAHASGIIAYYDGKPKGGTFYTCRKARLKGLDIINLYR